MYIKIKSCILDFLIQLTVTKSGQPQKIHKIEAFQNAGQAGRQAGRQAGSRPLPSSASDCLMSLDQQLHKLEDWLQFTPTGVILIDRALLVHWQLPRIMLHTMFVNESSVQGLSRCSEHMSIHNLKLIN